MNFHKYMLILLSAASILSCGKKSSKPSASAPALDDGSSEQTEGVVIPDVSDQGGLASKVQIESTAGSVEISSGIIEGLILTTPEGAVDATTAVTIRRVALGEGSFALEILGDHPLRAPILVTFPDSVLPPMETLQSVYVTYFHDGVTEILPPGAIVRDGAGKISVIMSGWGSLVVQPKPFISIQNIVGFDGAKAGPILTSPFVVNLNEDITGSIEIVNNANGTTAPSDIACESNRSWVTVNSLKISFAPENQDANTSAIVTCSLTYKNFVHQTTIVQVKVNSVDDMPVLAFSSPGVFSIKQRESATITWSLGDVDDDALADIYLISGLDDECSSGILVAANQPEGNKSAILRFMHKGSFYLCAKVYTSAGETLFKSPNAITVTTFCQGASLTGNLLSNGTGLISEPFIICTAAQLDSVASMTSYFDSHFELGADINLALFTGTQFHRIGTSALKFSGSFDGAGFKIQNFSYNDAAQDNVGLFGLVDTSGTIKNIVLENPNVVGNNYVGSLVGRIDDGMISGVTVTNAGVSGSNYVGGLAGSAFSVLDSTVNAAVNGISYVGGVSGSMVREIKGTSSSGAVTATGDYVGGIAGYQSSSCTGNCQFEFNSASNTVSGQSYVGGIAGYPRYSDINDSVFSGSVTGISYVGGIFGRSNTTQFFKRNLVNANISGVSQVGGIGGNSYYAKILDCAVTGNVTGSSSYIGGIVGVGDGNSSIFSSSYNGDVAGTSQVGGVSGSYSGRIIFSWAKGTATGTTEVGGIAGQLSGFTSASFAEVNVTASGARKGGIAGYALNATIDMSYASGTVNAGTERGGLLGLQSAGSISKGLWNAEASGIGVMCGSIISSGAGCDDGNGYTIAELKNSNTYAVEGWDLQGVADGPSDWWVLNPNAFPILWWEVTPPNLANRFTGGKGTADEPYLLANASELNSIGANPFLMKSHFRLTADVDIASLPIFYPIGDFNVPYAATFDGGNYTVTNLTINQPSASYLGMFTSVRDDSVTVVPDGSIVKNLVLTNVSITGKNYVGGVAGNSSGTIENVSSSGNVVGESYVGLVGGMVTVLKNVSGNGTATASVSRGGVVFGQANSSTVVSTNIVALGAASGGTYIGGVGGYSLSRVDGCSAAVNVTGTDYVGGFAGAANEKVSNCSSSGNITGVGKVGGFVGTSSNELTKVSATGTVTGSAPYVGGLVGNSSATILNSYATGAVTGTDSVGGLSGRSDYGTILGSYATGDVTGNVGVGGLIGYSYRDYRIKAVFSTGNVTGANNVGGFIGYIYPQTTTVSLTDIYIRGNVLGKNGVASNQFVGGFFGLMDPASGTHTIEYGYFTGTVANGTGVTGTKRLGIFAGYTTSASYTWNSIYWDNPANAAVAEIGYDATAASPIVDNLTVTAQTTVNMKDPAKIIYDADFWDFFAIWKFDATKNDGYPIIILPYDIANN